MNIAPPNFTDGEIEAQRGLFIHLATFIAFVLCAEHCAGLQGYNIDETQSPSSIEFTV